MGKRFAVLLVVMCFLSLLLSTHALINSVANTDKLSTLVRIVTFLMDRQGPITTNPYFVPENDLAKIR